MAPFAEVTHETFGTQVRARKTTVLLKNVFFIPQNMDKKNTFPQLFVGMAKNLVDF